MRKGVSTTSLVVSERFCHLGDAFFHGQTEKNCNQERQADTAAGHRRTKAGKGIFGRSELQKIQSMPSYQQNRPKRIIGFITWRGGGEHLRNLILVENASWSFCRQGEKTLLQLLLSRCDAVTTKRSRNLG